MRPPLKLLVAVFLAGALGMGLFTGLYHLWSDHQLVHIIHAYLLQQQEQQQKKPPPLTPGP